MKSFNPKSAHPARALQAWQILIGHAMNRQTTTYLGLSRLMYRKDAPGVLDEILGHIAFWCIDSGLPPLTSIVVGKHRGTPGADIPIDPATIDAQRENVYDYDWYDVYPPSETELMAAHKAHSSQLAT
ncbi:MAG TPA: hypothetical protein VJY39_11175 [Acidisphaera sp.]|nr:hypothetical protein [Acidisphaera sp.]